MIGDRAGLKAPMTVDVEVTATLWELVAAEGFAAHMTQSDAGVVE